MEKYTLSHASSNYRCRHLSWSVIQSMVSQEKCPRMLDMDIFDPRLADAFFGLAMDQKFFGRVKLTLNFDSSLVQGAFAILKSVPLNPASKGNLESSPSM